MGRTLPSITQCFIEESEALGRFRRALRRSDQVALDALLDAAQRHLAAVSYAGHALPFELFLLSIMLEQHKEIERLRSTVERAEYLPPG